MPLRCILLLMGSLISVLLQSQPIISSFSPKAAAIGSTITINGTGFNTDKTKNIVWVGSVQATVLSASATQLTVAVSQGACNGIVSVTNNGLTGESNRIFSTLFRKINATDTIQFEAAVKLTDPITDQNGGNGFEDIDRDGKADLFHINLQSKQIIIRRNISVGSQVIFDTIRYLINLPNAYIVKAPQDVYNYISGELVDMDGDGLKDILLTGMFKYNAPHCCDSIFVAYMKNESVPGKPSFAKAKIVYSDYVFTSVIYYGFTKDINKDGKPDVLLFTSKGVGHILLNSSNSSGIQFSTIIGGLGVTVNGVNPKVNLIDLNDDAKPEVFLDKSQIGSYNASFNLGQNLSTTTSPKFIEAPRQYVSRYVSPEVGIKVVDLNNDGKLDIGFLSNGLRDTSFKNGFRLTNSQVTSLSIFQNLSTIDTAKIGNSKELFFDSVLKGVRAFEVADLNSDQLPDLIFARSDTNAISVFINRSTATEFKFSIPIHLSYSPNSTNINSIKLSDLNGDGIPDIVLQNLDGSLYMLNNTTGFQDTVYRTALPTVIEQNIVSNKVYNIWPNPTKNILYLDKPTTQSSLYVDVSTLSGQRVALISPSVNAQSNYISVNVSTLVSGIYVVKVFDLNGLIYSKQFIKQ